MIPFNIASLLSHFPDHLIKCLFNSLLIWSRTQSLNVTFGWYVYVSLHLKWCSHFPCHWLVTESQIISPVKVTHILWCHFLLVSLHFVHQQTFSVKGWGHEYFSSMGRTISVLITKLYHHSHTQHKNENSCLNKTYFKTSFKIFSSKNNFICLP